VIADLTITRVFDAPREVVFRAWTDPEQVSQWWGPHGFSAPVVELDARPGGELRVDMQGPDGTISPITGVIHEVSEPERLVVTTRLVDGDGRTLIEALHTVAFEEEAGKTTLTLEVDVVELAPEAAEAREGMEEGWNQTLDRLGEHVATM
jgi:uncharacterized protein YndB with AHSA1/START domain